MSKISSYGYLFNARKFSFDVEDTVKNFCSFFDEVICVTVKSEDDTLERLRDLEKRYLNFKVIFSDIQILGNNRFDGQLKTLALQNCSYDLRVICDYDERFPLNQYNLWREMGESLLQIQAVDGLLIPVLDLYGNISSIRADQAIGLKFRIHKRSIVLRGVLPSAELTGGFFDTSKSDSTEPLKKDGQMGNFVSIISSDYLNPLRASSLEQIPHVFHLGYLDFERRLKLSVEFWKKAWEERSNKPENIVVNRAELESHPTIYHNLSLNI
jgi:hypothetical protein